MSTTTTNYGLVKPERSDNYSVDVMSGNMDKIDTKLKNLDTRTTVVESEVNGALSCTSVTTSGTITSTGLINANSGVKGYFKNTSATLVTSAPYSDSNVTAWSFSNVNCNSGTSKTITVSKAKTSMTTPYGNYTVSAPTKSIKFTVSTSQANGGYVTVKFDGVTKINGVAIGTDLGSSTPSSVSFTVDVDMSKAHTIVVSNQYNMSNYPLTLSANIKTLYLKVW